MTRHTPETVRPWTVEVQVATPAGKYAAGETIDLSAADGSPLDIPARIRHLLTGARRADSEAMDPRDARIVELEEQVRVLRAALAPFADESLDIQHRRDSDGFCPGIKVGAYRIARAALAATEEK